MSEAASWEDHYKNIAKAREDGFEVIYGDDTTLLLDLDTEEQVAQFKAVLPIFKKTFNVGEQQEWKSKSGNTHVLLKLKRPVCMELRVAMQAILGSDPARSICEVYQIIVKANPIALFKPKSKEF